MLKFISENIFSIDMQKNVDKMALINVNNIFFRISVAVTLPSFAKSSYFVKIT